MDKAEHIHLYDQMVTIRKLEEQAALQSVSYTHLRAHETVLDLVCRLLLEKKHPISTQHHQFQYQTTLIKSPIPSYTYTHITTPFTQ